MVLLGCASTAKAPDAESDQAAEESSDADPDAKRYERMPSQPYRCFGGIVFGRMTSGYNSASDIPNVLFDSCECGFRIFPDSFRRRFR